VKTIIQTLVSLFMVAVFLGGFYLMVGVISVAEVIEKKAADQPILPLPPMEIPIIPAVYDDPPAVLPALPPPPPAYVDLPALCTGYTPGPESCGKSADGKTSIMKDTDVHPYGIAADPKILPYGTKIVVPGYLAKNYKGHKWPVDDTGGAMRHAWEQDGIIHIDLRYKTVYSARRWGQRWVNIRVYTENLTKDQVQALITYRSQFED